MGSSTANKLLRWLAAGAALASLAWPVGAAADEAPVRDPQVAQSLFNRARTLMDAGSFAEACPMLEESQRLDPGGGTLLNLAVCLEGAGKLASAQLKFQEARSQALRDQREDRQKIAEERIAAIEPRLSRLTVHVAPRSRVRGVVVALDGSKLAEVAWGVPITVDGGEHRVDASAPGHESRRITLRVANEKDAPTVLVELTPKAPHARREESITRPRTRVSAAGWTVIGSGLGLISTGIGLGVAAVVVDDSAQSDAQLEGCNLARHYCPGASADDFAARANLAQALGWAATTGSLVGAVVLLIGPFQREAVVQPMVAPAKKGAILGVEGSF